MKWKNQDIRLTETLWGQQIGLKPVTEGQWAVYFEHLELSVCSMNGWEGCSLPND
tara:strand:+ start:464 stop:628 length:165 start_codon:yes stop_codon:yes gene_type:complete